MYQVNSNTDFFSLDWIISISIKSFKGCLRFISTLYPITFTCRSFMGKMYALYLYSCSDSLSVNDMSPTISGGEHGERNYRINGCGLSWKRRGVNVVSALKRCYVDDIFLFNVFLSILSLIAALVIFPASSSKIMLIIFFSISLREPFV